MRFFPPMRVNAGVRHILTLITKAGGAPVAIHRPALRNAGALEHGALA